MRCRDPFAHSFQLASAPNSVSPTRQLRHSFIAGAELELLPTDFESFERIIQLRNPA
jgi:hypothetical protein